MEAKEKALRMCQDFGMTGMDEKQTDFFTLDLSLAKKCALICVDEIIDIENRNKQMYGFNEVNYWMEVKEEINKL